MTTQTILVLAAALAPVVVLMLYIYNKDKEAPEPTSLLLKALWYGVISIFISLGISFPLMFAGIVPDAPNDFWSSVNIAFLGASVPEELAKFFMFWLLIRKNKHFDEHLDGVVYAACVALGFAAFENVMYLFCNIDNWVHVGVSRALLSVPIHFGCGIIMGYYYSLIHFNGRHGLWDKLLVVLVPILIHGIYDAILFYQTVTPEISVIAMIAVLWFCNKVRKRCSARIEELLAMGKANRDMNITNI